MLRVLKKYIQMFSTGQKIKLTIILIMMVVGGVLETLGVSLIVPLMTTILDGEFMNTNRVAAAFCNLFGITNRVSFMLLLLGALILVFVLKDGFLFLEYYVQTRFMCNGRLRTQQKLMRAYVYRPYEYYLNASSGEITRVMTSDVINAFNLLGTTLTFYTEMIVGIALLVAIVVIDPAMASMLGVILVIEILVIYKLVKPTLKVAGQTFLVENKEANNWILQAISGIKELKVASREEYFINQYSEHATDAIAAEKKNIVLGYVPRLLIEAVTIAALLAFMMLLIVGGRSVDSLMPQLSAFAVAAVRLLPATNRMSSAMNLVAYAEPALDKTLSNMNAISGWDEQLKQAGNTGQMTLEKQCELKDLTYRYPNTKQPVLNRVNMVIPVGASVGVVGASGSGKTTAIDVLLGVLKPEQGQVLADGTNIRENYGAWLDMIGYIPQMIFMLNDTIRANVAFGIPAHKIDDAQVWKALEEAKLKEFVEGLPQGLDTSIGERGVRISGGQRQRIGIARALYKDPKLLVFDEATSALDNETEAAIMESINALHGKKTMVIIAHRLTTIEGCDLIYRIEDGAITRQ